MKKYSLFFSLFIILTASCNRKVAPLQSLLQTEGMHHKWKVTEMAGEGTAQLPYIFIDLRDVEKSGGSAGCDSLTFTPKYWYNNRIDLMHIAVGQSQCKGGTLVDKAFADNLNKVYYFKLAEDKLWLSDKNHTTLFTATIDPSDENSSIKRKWLISKMINADTKQLEVSKPFIDFTNTTNAIANVGCNTINFSVTVSGTYNIVVGEAASTRMFCKDAAVNEEVFLKILPIVNMYQVIGNKLRLFDKDNALLIEASAPLQ